MSGLSSTCLPETGASRSYPVCGAESSRAWHADSQRDASAIRRGFSWLAVGNIVNAACSWGRLALLARLGNAEMIGQLALALAVCGPIGDLADLGLSGALISDVRRQFRLRDYLILRVLTCALMLVIVAAVVCTGGYGAADARLIMLAGVLVACESLGEIFQAILQREENMQWVAVSSIVRGVLGLALFAVILCSLHNLAWSVCGFCAAAAATLVVIDIPRALACEKRTWAWNLKSQISDFRFEILDLKSEIPKSLTEPRAPMLIFRGEKNGTLPSAMNIKSLLCLTWLSLPLGLATASLSLTASIPRYWIGAQLGNKALGGFAVAGSFMIALSLVAGALSQAACPRLARYHAVGNRAAFMRLLVRLSICLAIATIASVAVMAVAGRFVLGLLFGPAFVSYAPLATCLMLAGGLRSFSILLGRAIASMRQFRTGLAMRLSGIVVLILLLPGWIGWLGAMGAAWAVMLSWSITTLLSLAVVLRVTENGDKSPSFKCPLHE